MSGLSKIAGLPQMKLGWIVAEYGRQFASYGLRHSVQPGITGWAQVRFGYAANSEETKHKLTYDLFYVKSLSPMLDLKIALFTIPTILFGPTGGNYHAPDEWVSLSSCVKAVEIVAATAADFCA